ncbi:glycerate kinase [Ascidiimonas sp. W6]|uniref:glycerate kinase n=1 Tax=Ascidiimonas meishanensis TaxID=3128903 RepID=UPI0030EEF16C
MAEASGLKVLKSRKPNCMQTSSLGAGELIKDAIYRGAKEIILGIGGSATNDAGMGIASALGYRFTGYNDEVLQPIGENLVHVANIESKNVLSELANVRFLVACDVQNLFYGNDGASYVYAPQKGATPHQVKLLDIGLRQFSSVLFKKFGKDVQTIKGAGAAGGVGGGSICFLNAELISGIEMILKFAQFSDKIKGADFIITGEGLIDIQTSSGKTIKGIVSRAKKENIPVIAMCGSSMLTEEQQQTLGVDCVFCIQKGVTDLQFAIQNTSANLEYTAFNFASLIQSINKNTRN